MSDEARYDERQVALILKRVAELHERDADGDARTMSRAELEEVVGELGMSTALVRRAVADLAVRDRGDQAVWWLGGKTGVSFEAEVAGSIDEETMTAMVEVLRRLLGEPGTLSRDGAARIWSTRESSRRVFFTVVARANGTTLRLEERMPIDARTTVGGSAFAGGFGGFLGVLPLKVLIGKAAALMAMGPLAAAGGAAGWMVGRALWRRRSERRELDLQQAFSHIVDLASA